MKRSLQFALVLTLAASCACISACNLTESQKQQITAHALKTGDAALLGLLTGGKAGAIAGLREQEIANIKERQQKTAAKNPPAVPVNP